MNSISNPIRHTYPLIVFMAVIASWKATAENTLAPHERGSIENQDSPACYVRTTKSAENLLQSSCSFSPHYLHQTIRGGPPTP